MQNCGHASACVRGFDESHQTLLPAFELVLSVLVVIVVVVAGWLVFNWQTS